MQAFQVGGMKCGHCVRTVTEAVQSVVPGAWVDVDRAAGRVSVDSAAIPDLIAQAIQAKGYAAQAVAG